MRNVILRTLAFVAGVTALGVPACSQDAICDPGEVADARELADLIDCASRALVVVWRDDIRQAARTAGIDLSGVGLLAHEGCVWRPEWPSPEDPSKISYGKTLLYYSNYLQQAYLLYLLGRDEAATPEMVNEYLQERLLPALRDDVRHCSVSGEQPRGYPSAPIPSILEGKVSAERYNALMQYLSGHPTMPGLGDATGGLPVIFALLHEAGHALLHPREPQGRSEDEVEADEFASRVFVATDMPVALGLGHLELFYYNNRALENPAVACRLAMLARRYPTGRSFAEDYGRDVYDRLEALRKSYVARYGESCSGDSDL